MLSARQDSASRTEPEQAVAWGIWLAMVVIATSNQMFYTAWVNQQIISKINIVPLLTAASMVKMFINFSVVLTGKKGAFYIQNTK